MKKGYLFVIQVITVVLLAVCVFKISSLKQQIQSMENHILNRISNAEQEIGNITYEVSNALEEEASLLSFDRWSYGKVNAKNKSVEVICEITPKEYSSKTETEIVYKDKSYPLAFENGKFIGTITVPLFEDIHIPLVQFTEDIMVRTEELKWYLYPKNEVLPIIYAEAPDSYSYSWKNGATEHVFTYSGNIFVKGDSAEDTKKIKEAYLVECLDGIESSRTKFALGNMNDAFVLHDLELEEHIPFGSLHEVYVETIDIYGFHHRNIVFRKKIDEYGEITDEQEWYYGFEGDIYDSEGILLYKAEY